jgi:hypothetical protein
LDDCETVSHDVSGLIWGLFVSFCLTPGESSHKPPRSIRGWWLRPNIAYLAAQRSALANQVATAALAPSAASMAVRMVAGPVGWAALGVSAGLVLAQMYYSQPTSPRSKRPPHPGGWQVASTNAGVQTFPGFGTNTPGNPAYPNATIQFQRDECPAVCGRYRVSA